MASLPIDARTAGTPRLSCICFDWTYTAEKHYQEAHKTLRKVFEEQAVHQHEERTGQRMTGSRTVQGFAAYHPDKGLDLSTVYTGEDGPAATLMRRGLGHSR
jgi:hypothetical protein